MGPTGARLLGTQLCLWYYTVCQGFQVETPEVQLAVGIGPHHLVTLGLNCRVSLVAQLVKNLLTMQET